MQTNNKGFLRIISSQVTRLNSASSEEGRAVLSPAGMMRGLPAARSDSISQNSGPRRFVGARPSWPQRVPDERALRKSQLLDRSNPLRSGWARSVMVAASPRCDRLVLPTSGSSIQSEWWSALTLTLTPRRGNFACPRQVESDNSVEFQRSGRVLPLPGGEGWGEGERSFSLDSCDFGKRVCALFALMFALVFTASRGAAADAAGSELPPAASRSIDFAKDIQPIFEKNCYDCHGAKKQEAAFRLDQKDVALKGGELGPAIIPGKSAESLLIQAVAGLKDDLVMPKKGERLTIEQIGLLRAWIDQGADWPESLANRDEGWRNHWAFMAPRRPPLPEVQPKKWARTPIDHFVLTRLEKEALKPSPEADKVTLLRRLYLDLIGLPPTPEEIDAFLLDNSAEAWPAQVEKLLASPHYGERWARHWLDAARYADSDGFEKDKPRFIWNFRDWVVGALNRDLPYDQFIVEQIAGDLLPNPTQDQLVATGFLRNSMLNEEGGVDPEQFRMDAMFDRMDAIGKSVLGLTIQCAQCHSHKYDPLSQEEYYRMFTFLNNDHEASVVAYSPVEQLKRADLLRQMRDLEEGLRHTKADWQERMAQWEDSVKNDQPEWTVVECRNAGDNGERFYHYPDDSIRAASYAPTQWTAHFRGTNSLPSIGAFRFEHLTDPNLPCHGPGRSIKGMAALSEFKVEAVDAQNPTNKVTLKFVKATADFANDEKPLEPEFQSESRKKKDGDKRTYGPVALAIDGNGDTAWGIDAGPGRRNQPRKAVFVPDKPLQFTNGVVLNFNLQQNHGGDNSDDNQNHNLGRFRISATSSTNAVADPLPAGVREILKVPREQRTPTQVATVFSYWRTTVPEFKEVNDKIEALWKQWPEGAPTLTLLARTERGPGDERRPTHMFKRGDWLKPGKEVAFGVPSFLHPLPPKADDSRLTFAKWLTDGRSPTTARVLVNRVWQTYFGTGLVDTPEDFGLRAPPPSHPELLDWLAVEFMHPQAADGESELRTPNSNLQTSRPWSLKHLHRLIVNSATYRQSSRVTPELYEKDQFNRLLARGPRFRVEGEIVRDIALAASGLLNPKLGGPSLMPPAPSFLFQPPASYGPKVWNEETGPDRYRRGIYTFRFRSVPYPVLQAFDAPNGDFSCVRRARSNTPLQALTSLNEVLFMECAQALAARSFEHAATDEERIRYAFRRCVGRQPESDELGELLDLLHKQKAHLAEGWVSVAELATGKNEPLKNLPKGVTPTQLAAHTVVSRALLNLDETITKE
ncbi:MAG: PSD1 and planctomycete cytochrome C domain-containing protein [Verrucomicrobiales bacterium]|nr:PSD1 and planctomycete cytochrome C domain-containing protein [Verrucomicrobiales bacterium]